MKMLSRLISAAFILLCAASCNPTEINNDTPDNPQNPEQPGQPQQSELKFSASILKTRVDYSNEDGDSLNPVWEVGDVLYGFYGDDTDHSIILRVVSVDESGKASLNLEYITGSVANITDDTSVYLIYTGAHIESGASITPSDYAFTNGELSVSLTSQNPPRIPVCMSASAKPTNSGGGDRYISFSFQKDCAIIEIDGLPGLAEDWCITSETALSGITVSGLCLNGKYTFNNEKLTFGADNSAESPSSISFTGCKVDSKGAIENSSGSKILIAVVPNGLQDFTITASTAEKQDISIPYGDKTLEKDKCYVITAKPVVARTSDGQYFTTVTGAFDHANAIKSTYSTAGTNIVTLVRDCGFAGVTKQQDGTYTSNVGVSNPLLINGYDVTLDLNGYILSLAGGDLFVVNGVYDDKEDDYVQNLQTLNTFIINDFKGKNADGKYDGKIYYLSNEKKEYSSDGEHIIRNFGRVQIDGGTLWNNDDWCAVRNYLGAVLTVNDGELFSESWYTIHNEGSTVIMINGKVSSKTSSAIYSDEGTVNICGGFIESGNEKDITRELEIGESRPLTNTIQVLNGANCTISGGVIYNKVDGPAVFCASIDGDNSVLTVTWPKSESFFLNTEMRYGPIICVAGVHTTNSFGFNHTPISAYDSTNGDGGNDAVVSIQGGYLISSNSSYSSFYSGDGSASSYYNLDIDNIGGFYSNKEKILYSGSGNGNTKDLNNSGNGFTINQGDSSVTVYATSQGGDSGFALPIINVASGELWYIHK